MEGPLPHTKTRGKNLAKQPSSSPLTTAQTPLLFLRRKAPQSHGFKQPKPFKVLPKPMRSLTVPVSREETGREGIHSTVRSSRGHRGLSNSCKNPTRSLGLLSTLTGISREEGDAGQRVRPELLLTLGVCSRGGRKGRGRREAREPELRSGLRSGEGFVAGDAEVDEEDSGRVRVAGEPLRASEHRAVAIGGRPVAGDSRDQRQYRR